MSNVEYVFRLSRGLIKSGSQDRARGIQELITLLIGLDSTYPKKIRHDNDLWFFTKDNQTKNDWTVIETMLEAFEIPIQCREFGLFGFFRTELSRELMLQNFNFLKAALPAPEKTKFTVQKLNFGALQFPGHKATLFRFSHSTLEVTTDTTLILSNDEINELDTSRIRKGMSIWEIICNYPFFRPIKYVLAHSVSNHVSPKGKTDTMYEATLYLATKEDN